MDVDTIFATIANLVSFLLVLALSRPVWQRRREPAAALFLAILAAFGLRSLYALADDGVGLLQRIFPGGRLATVESIQASWPLGPAALFLSTAFWLHFFWLYPTPVRILRRCPWLPALFYVPMGALTAILLVVPLLPTPVQQTWSGLFSFIQQATPMVGAAALLGGFGRLLATHLRAPEGYIRRTSRDLLYGLAGALALGGSLYLLPQLAGWTMPAGLLPLLEPLLLLILLSTFAFAIVRDRLFDAPLVLSIGVAYAAATLILTFVYLILVVGAAQLFSYDVLISNPLLPAGFALLVAVALNPLRLRLQDGVDRLFYRQRYNYRQVVRQFGQDLSQLQELTVLTRLILERIVHTWQLHTGALALRAEEGTPYQVRECVGLPETSRDLAFAPDSAVAQVLRQRRQPVVWSPEEDRLLAEAERGALRSLVSTVLVPIHTRDRLIGWLHLGEKRSEQRYTADDLELLGTMADRAGVALENALLYERRRREVAALEALNEVARAVSSSIRLDELLPALARAVQRVVDAPNLAVILYDAARAEFSMALHAMGEEMGRAEETRWPAGFGLVSLIVQDRQPIVTGDYAAECERRGIQGSGRQGKAWMGVPMVSGDAVIGVLVASSFSPETVYREDDVRLLSTVAAQAATAVQNARLYERTDAALSRRVVELTALDEIARELNTALDLQHVLEVVLDRARKAVGATAGSVGIRTADGLSLMIPALQGYPPEANRHRSTPWSIHQGIVGRVARTNRPALIPDVRQDSDYVEFAPGTLSELAVPIAYAGQPIGVINLESAQPAAFDEEHLRFVQSLADHAAIAINNARLFQERERRITELGIFNEIGEALATALDLGELLQAVLQQVGRLFDTTNFYIAAYDEETDEYEILLDTEENSRTLPTRYRVGAGLTGYIIRHRTPLHFQSSAQMEAFEKMMDIEPIGPVARSWLGVPLVASDKLVGVMAIQNYEQGNLYNEQDQALFSTVAVQVAIAIANARLFQRTSEARDRLQAILNSTRDGIILLNEEGRILLTNPPVQQWTRLEPHEMVGRTLLEFLRRSTRGHRETRLALIAELTRALYTLHDKPMAHLRGSFDAPFWEAESIEWRLLPVLDQGGQRIARIVVLRDVSEERETERMRQDLDSMIVHDLRGPLTVILGSLETTLEKDIGALTEPQRSVLVMAQESAQRMQGLVNTLLDIRRLEAGKMPLRFAPEAIADLAQTAIKHVEPLARDTHLVLSLEVPTDLPRVQVDAEAVTRVLENLLTNAVKFSYPGQSIRVLATADGGWVRCAVVDYGVGIPKSEIDRIFEKYVQVASPGKRRGTGLGLAFCRLAVEAHGGTITVESKEGKGSTFSFTVPVWQE